MMSIKTILVVENDPVSLSMYRKRLECEGFRIESAQDGLEATTMLSENPPDLVLLDLMLPKLNGSVVLEFMHADPRLTTIPVIILSNAPMTEVPPDSPLAKGTRRLVKGECTFATLLQAIQETLAESREFVVVESGAKPAVPSPAAGNGQGNGNGSGSVAAPDPGADAIRRRIEFVKVATAEFPKIRENCLAYIKAPDSPTSQVYLSGLHQRVHLLSSNAGQAGCNRLARLTTTFDSLLSGIATKPASVTPSILQTIAQAVDCVGVLLKTDNPGATEPALPTKVLIVDDDPVCNHVNVSSLKRTGFDATGIEDPLTALRQLEANQFDLVVLDVNMPGITGFELCEKIRRLPHCKTIPVIFVTAYSNFDNRKQCVLSGGDDFATKPVSPVELALKVTVHLIKARSQRPRTARPETHPAPANDQGAAPAKGNGADRPEPTLKSQPPAARFPASLSEQALQPMTSTRTGRDGADGTEGSKSPQQPAADASPSPAASTRIFQPAQPRSAQTKTPQVQVPATESANNNLESVVASETAAPASEPCAVSVPAGSPPPATSEQASVQQHPVSGSRAAGAPREIPPEFSRELESARSAAKQAEQAREEEAGRCRRMGEELTELRRVHAELQTSFTSEQQSSAKIRKDFEGLQTELQRARTELDKVRADFERQSSELAAAKTASGTSESALKEKEESCRLLEEELAGLRRAREELQSKAANEEQAAAKLRADFEGLQSELRRGRTELDKVRADFERQSSELAAAKTASGTSESALKEKEESCRLLEEELAGLRQAREELESKAASEEQAAAKLRADFEGLQTELQRGRTELDKLRADFERQSSELAAAKTASGTSESALKEKEESCRLLEEELAGLRRAREELQSKAANEEQATAKLRNDLQGLCDELQQTRADLQKARADFEAQSAELIEAKETAGESEGALKEREAGWKQMETELASLRQAHEELQNRTAQEGQTSAELRGDFEALQTELQQSRSKLEEARTDLERQSADLDAVKTALAKKESALQEKERWSSLMEEELTGLRRGRDELESRLNAEQAASAKVLQDHTKLQEQFQGTLSELEHIRADLPKQSAELAAAKASFGEKDSALADKEMWNGLLEEELTGLRRARGELQAKVAAGEKTAADLRQEINGLEERLRQCQAGLEQTRTELHQQSTERIRVESEYRNIADTTETLRKTLFHLRETIEDRARALPEDASAAKRLELVQSAEQVAPAEEAEYLAPSEPDESANPAVLEASTDPSEPSRAAESATTTTPAEPPSQSAHGQTFRLSAPAAKRVLLTGDFTNWRERAIPMESDNDGIWTATVDLPPGTYQYLFVVDDEWRGDPECSLRAPNSVGGYNMVRQVP